MLVSSFVGLGSSGIQKASAASNFEINIFLPDGVENPQKITDFSHDLGVSFSSAKWYLDWTDNFTPEIARGFQSQNVIPELVWQPQKGNECVTYQSVTTGQYYAYLNNFADQVKNLNFNTRITLAPEMNGDWEPWAVGNCGNTSDGFKSFWRYVVEKFRSRGASNVSWIWAPNVRFDGETASYSDLYPGDNYVDFLGLEGYNWGTSQSWGEWQSFSEVFGPSYNNLVNISGKNIIITEFASTETGGDKARWIAEMFSVLRSNFPKIKGITWFNINKETDWRIESSAASKASFSKYATLFLNGSPIDPSSVSGSSQSRLYGQNANNSNNKNNPTDPTATATQKINESRSQPRLKSVRGMAAKSVSGTGTAASQSPTSAQTGNLILALAISGNVLLAIILIFLIINRRRRLV